MNHRDVDVPDLPPSDDIDDIGPSSLGEYADDSDLDIDTPSDGPGDAIERSESASGSDDDPETDPTVETAPGPSDAVPGAVSTDDRARLLARLVAAGVPLHDAARTLRISAADACEITSSPTWPALLREEVSNVDVLYDEDAVRRMLDPVIPHAIELKKQILTDENAALNLRNEVASEILKIAGLHRTRRSEVHVFLHPAAETVRATVDEFRSLSAGDDE